MSTIKSREFGKTKDGQTVTAFDLSNNNGMSVTILDFGATVQSIYVRDKNGVLTDVVLGYDDIASYEIGTCYYGAVVGRHANRIGGARFVLNNKEYTLTKSQGEENHLHGIFIKKMFEAHIKGDALKLTYLSPDMEEGFPGNLSVEVEYSLSEDNALTISYTATTDAPTPVNLTNHSYFNLNGQDGSTVFDHKVTLNSSSFTEYDESFAQTGRIIPVDNSPLDFRTEHSIGERFYDDYYQFRLCTGYDHNMIIDDKDGRLKLIGTVKNDKNGLCLKAYTTEPSFQFYSANYIHFDAAANGKNGIKYPKNGGLCFEAQHYPDSLNHNNFPSVILNPGETYKQKTVYIISV